MKVTRERSTIFSAPLMSQGYTIGRPFLYTRQNHIAGSGLDVTSVALCEQMRVADRARLMKNIGYLDSKLTAQLDEAIAITLGLKRL
jgi:mRNA-degrading endonuclease toxin of MazEF toxin-antitoxin module